jgi:sterol desaturase/sphingolipid hydroxylase (fatty acid hydroxylase superfamily)
MLILLIVLCGALFMILYERRCPGRSWPEVRYWWLRAIFLNGLQVGTVYVAGLSWDRWMLKWHHGSLTHVSSFWGGIIGYLSITFIFYWWHRIRHANDFLWRWLHQLHHSPQRLEIITAFYKHPFELIADSVICSAILYIGLGLAPAAAANAVLLSALAELFYHWNIKTPYLLGYIFQRPESHCVHHQYGVHAYNYSDLPLWDILFGTFKNPKKWNAQCGLGQEEHRFIELLFGINVTQNIKKDTTK